LMAHVKVSGLLHAAEQRYPAGTPANPLRRVNVLLMKYKACWFEDGCIKETIFWGIGKGEFGTGKRFFIGTLFCHSLL
jgi:hypothetical protein